MYVPQSTVSTKGTTPIHDFCSVLVRRYLFLSRIPQDVGKQLPRLNKKNVSLNFPHSVDK